MRRRLFNFFCLVTSAMLAAALLILWSGHTANAMSAARFKLLDVSQTVNGLTVRVRAARLEGNQTRFNVCYPLPNANINDYLLRNVTLEADGQMLTSTDGWLDEWLYADGSRIMGWQMNTSQGLTLFQSKGQPQSRCDWVAFGVRRAASMDRATLTIGGLGISDGPQATTYQPANLGLEQMMTDYRAGPWRFDLSLK